MKKDVLGYCGKEGRTARAVVRGGDNPDMGYWEATDHIKKCRNCQHRIQGTINNNADTTTYRGAGWQDAIAAATRRESTQRREYGW